jgi:phosphoribosylanthranilate isomerase
MGADKLTFVLDPALPDYLDVKSVKELAGWVAGVQLIGEFDQLSAPQINAMAADCGLDAVLLHSFRTDEELAEIAPPVYLEVPLESLSSAATTSAPVAGVVVPLTGPVTTETMRNLQEIGEQVALWLGPGLEPTAAQELARSLPLAGLFFPSGNEVKPGLRDFDQLEAVFEALEVD